MADTPKIDLEIKDTAKMELTTPYSSVNPLYELASNKIADLNMAEMSPEAYPTANAVITFVYDKTNYLAEISNAAIQQSNQTAIQIGDQEHGLDTKESFANKVQNITENLDTEKYPSTKAVFEFVMLTDNSCKAYATDYTNQKIGDIETALDSIIALQNQYTGGDAI